MVIASKTLNTKKDNSYLAIYLPSHPTSRRQLTFYLEINTTYENNEQLNANKGDISKCNIQASLVNKYTC